MNSEATVAASSAVLDSDSDDELCSSKERVMRKSFVHEWKILEDLVHTIVTNGGAVEISAVKRAQVIMDKYQEQGQLLEPHLESIVSPLMNIVRAKTIEIGFESDSIMGIIKPLCILIYTLVTVCSYKTVIRFLPHQVSDLELAVSLLEKCHGTSMVLSSLRQESTGEMETKCTMLLWLSILVLIPFDMSSVDTALAGAENCSGKDSPPPLVERMITVCKDYLSNPGPMRKMAGVLLSRLVTRPDMKSALKSLTTWTQEALGTSTEDTNDIFLVPGIFEAMAAIFKVGGRDVLLDVASVMWQETCNLTKSVTAARSPLLRKLLIKLTQRIGLTYLPQRVPLWRYVGTSSSLGHNLTVAASAKNHQNYSLPEVTSATNVKEVQEEEMDVPEVIEEIIEQLLAGLRDKDTVVRWSAAKGIGRVTGRLTAVLADEVLASILELFSPGEGDGSWHGGCLALAELARRGLLLPERLPEVVPVIIKALHYDVRRGPHSVGSHVRDAAAYVCWAFGRAYSHSVMKGILEELAPHLLTIACYDREVNCRRAAAAAFQENVGRQGSFPHGIDIVNAADYFSLATRSNSYQDVAVYIAQFNMHLSSFVEELLQNKICHWDRSLRELAAVALASLVKYDVAFFGGMVLDKLIPCTLSTDLNLRHGATLAIAEIVQALHDCSHQFSSDKQKAIAGIVPAIEKARLYRGKGGEIMRASVCKLIECTSVARIPLSSKIQKILLDTLNENMRHPNAQIQVSAVKALKQFVHTYLISADTLVIKDITSKYLLLLRNDPNVAAKRGSALALSALPNEFLFSDWANILKTLCAACLVPDNPDDRDAETRVNAVRGIATVCETLTCPDKDSRLDATSQESVLSVIKNDVIECLFKALNDYSVDNRGDVGSWVREAAMEALERCTYILCRNFTIIDGNEIKTMQTCTVDEDSITVRHEKNALFDANLAGRLIGGIVKQAVEKIDKVRDIAGRTLQRILYNKNIFVPSIPHRHELEAIVPRDMSFNWVVPSSSFQCLVHLLQLSEYRVAFLSGLVISIGGLAESLRKASLSALLDYLNMSNDGEPEINKEKEKWLSIDLLQILQHHPKVDRVTIPTLKECAQRFGVGIINSLTIELKGSKDVSKLLTGVNVLGHVCTMQESIQNEALPHFLLFLSHPYPKVRKACADQVYLLLIQLGEQLLDDDRMNKALELIGETCWEGPREETNVQKLKVFDIFNLKVPSAQFTSHKSDKWGSKQKADKSDENASYASLIDSIH
ncbi:tubulin-folding cofactor D isoform X2 [Cryptomeria japonica]|uniref:tubulin-folding cofactor D isoform X2 n=1 Tax=Cryptomeria japonica TaxID=3369 RepID=UPI0027DAB133|nr:tubulin-folding cofactor D isoform X2 [Cryptomeria japonica]